MVREGKVVRTRTDCLLGTDRSLFRNVSVWDPRHNTGHFMVVGCLRSAPEREHTGYIMGRRKCRYGHLQSLRGRTGSLRP